MRLLRIPLAWWYWLINRNDKLAQERIVVCAKCHLLKWGVCMGCGCPVIAKSRLEDEQCPLNKWKK